MWVKLEETMLIEIKQIQKEAQILHDLTHFQSLKMDIIKEITK